MYFFHLFLFFSIHFVLYNILFAFFFVIEHRISRVVRINSKINASHILFSYFFTLTEFYATEFIISLDIELPNVR